MLYTFTTAALAFAPTSSLSASKVLRADGVSMVAAPAAVKPVVIGVAADSGCGKSTFMRRLTSIFGGESAADIGARPTLVPT